MAYNDRAADWINDPEKRLARKNAFDGSLAHGTAAFNKNTGRITPKSRPFIWAIDKETGLIRADLVRARRCPVCDASPGAGLFVKDGFRHVKCPACGLIYVSLILREDVIEKYWREELAWLGVLQSEQQIEMDRLKFNYGLDLIEAAAPDGGRRILDVGSGSGLFVRLAGERGWNCSALDMNYENGAKLAREGYRVIVKPLEMADLPDASFDVVSFWEVLEHLAAPRTALAEAKRLLGPGGLLFVLVPNVMSLVTRLLHEKSNTFGGHSHLNHFSPESLRALIEGAGFKVLDMETVISELGTINNHLAFEDPYMGEAESTLPGLSPERIHRNFLGSRLLVLASKA